jgi:hypothetical protein
LVVADARYPAKAITTTWEGGKTATNALGCVRCGKGSLARRCGLARSPPLKVSSDCEWMVSEFARASRQSPRRDRARDRRRELRAVGVDSLGFPVQHLPAGEGDTALSASGGVERAPSAARPQKGDFRQSSIRSSSIRAGDVQFPRAGVCDRSGRRRAKAKPGSGGAGLRGSGDGCKRQLRWEGSGLAGKVDGG